MNNNWRENLVNDLEECAKSILKNSESIIGTEQYLSSITVTIYLEPHAVPRINVDRDFHPEGLRAQ